MVIGSKLQIKRGRYGSSKVKAFSVLNKGVLTARQLCVLTGIGYYSLARALPRWTRFEYVARDPILYGGFYEYALTAKARMWLRLAAQYLPNYALFVQELNTWQDNLAEPTINLLMRMRFNDFTQELDFMVKEFQENMPK
ncbi:hypothetical protein ACFLV8_02270 [Chloroflexota bacterium]